MINALILGTAFGVGLGITFIGAGAGHIESGDSSTRGAWINRYEYDCMAQRSGSNPRHTSDREDVPETPWMTTIGTLLLLAGIACFVILMIKTQG